MNYSDVYDSFSITCVHKFIVIKGVLEVGVLTNTYSVTLYDNSLLLLFFCFIQSQMLELVARG